MELLSRQEQEAAQDDLVDNQLPYLFLSHIEKKFCAMYPFAFTYLSREANWVKKSCKEFNLNTVYRLPHDFKLPPLEKDEYELVPVKQDTEGYCYKREHHITARHLQDAINDPDFIGVRYEGNGQYYPCINRLESEFGNTTGFTSLNEVVDGNISRAKPLELLFVDKE